MPKIPEKVCVRFLGFKPKCVVPPSLVIGTHLHCKFGFYKKAYKTLEKAENCISVSVLIITCT